jgi:hypothetical protein
MAPDNKANQTANDTHSAEPGVAKPFNEAEINTQVKAAGPTDKRLALPNITANKAGNKQAYKPVTSGMPANCA